MVSCPIFFYSFVCLWGIGKTGHFKVNQNIELVIQKMYCKVLGLGCKPSTNQHHHNRWFNMINKESHMVQQTVQEKEKEIPATAINTKP